MCRHIGGRKPVGRGVFVLDVFCKKDILGRVSGSAEMRSRFSKEERTGKAVKIGRGRAAVIGDDRREIEPLFGQRPEWEGSGGRMTREPEDLPES